jgi:uncharacterized protein YeaC (DUF1315 family)
MSIFNIFRSNSKDTEDPNNAKIEFGFRGEGIVYRLREKEIYIDFTYINGPRIYTDSIEKWNDGSILTIEEKEKIFTDILNFASKSHKKKLIIVINTDDPSKNLWEQVCLSNQELIKEVENTSDEEQFQFERNMYLDFVNPDNGLTIGDTEIKNEQDLDKALQSRRKIRTI